MRLSLSTTMAAAAAAVLGFGGSAMILASLDPQARTVHAHWKRVFSTPREMTRGVEAIALARATGIAPGRMAYSDDSGDSLPFEEVSFEVVRGIEGLTEGQDIVVERVGGLDAEGSEVHFDADGGSFEVGEDYRLFLDRIEGSDLFRQVNHQGRFHVHKGRLRGAHGRDPVVELLDDSDAEAALFLIEGWRRSSGPRGSPATRAW